MASTQAIPVFLDHIELHTFAASSGSRPGRRHFVTVRSTGQLTCSCEAGLFGRADCRHRAAVRSHLVGFGWDGTTPAPTQAATTVDADPFLGLLGEAA